MLLAMFRTSGATIPLAVTLGLEEVRQFEDRHSIGTKARLALALLLFTGQRRSDITRFGR
jgi:hypothetical protein